MNGSLLPGGGSAERGQARRVEAGRAGQRVYVSWALLIARSDPIADAAPADCCASSSRGSAIIEQQRDHARDENDVDQREAISAPSSPRRREPDWYVTTRGTPLPPRQCRGRAG